MEEIRDNVDNNKSRKQEMHEKYVRRAAILKSKFPEIINAPESIQREYFAATNLISYLDDRSYVWNATNSSDGFEIDEFVAKKYEIALANFSEANKENSQYITEEEEANFEFPEINFDELKEKLQQADESKYYSKFHEIQCILTEFNNELWPKGTRDKLSAFKKEFSEKFGKLIKEEKIYDVDGVMKSEQELLDEKAAKQAVEPVVDESKFAEIYKSAKGRIKNAFLKIKEIFRGSKEKDKDNSHSEQGNR